MLNILKKHSILYVEDELEIQANMKEYLESYFHTVDVASNGEDALKLYNKNRQDVLLLDINLPYLDGLSVAKEVRNQDMDTKIIMLTAHTDREKLLAATELKLTKYLVKPLTPKVFKEALHVLAKELMLSTSSSYLKFSTNYFWDRERKILITEEKEVLLLEKERRLLNLLIEKKSSVVSYEEIMVTLWDDSFEREISIESVKNQIRTLRKKIPKDTIENVYGQGYVYR